MSEYRTDKNIRDKKLFLFIQYFDVHSDWEKLPYDSAPPYNSMFSEDYTTDFDGGGDGKYASQYLLHVNRKGIKIKEYDLEYIISLYDGGIAYMDKCIGELFDMLKSLRLYENSLIILTSDHGEEFQEHGYMLHGNPYMPDELIHVPLILKLPGKGDHSGTIKNLVEHVDIMPSILNFLDIKSKPKMQGRNFFPMINGVENGNRRIFAFANNNACIRSDRWKMFFRYTTHSGEIEIDRIQLFDLITDPTENQDVKNKYPELVKTMKHDVVQKFEEIGILDRTKEKREKVTHTHEQLEKLKALGYIE